MAWKDENNKWHTESDIPNTESALNSITTSIVEEDGGRSGGIGIHTLPPSVMTVYELDGQGGPLIVKVNSMKPPKLGRAFNLSLDDVLIVPMGAAEAYKADEVWGKFYCIRESVNLKPGKTGIAESDELAKRVEVLEDEVEKLKEVISAMIERSNNLKD